jgi:hypothetical protein
MYRKELRQLDPWLALAALMPADEILPPLETASPEAVREVAGRWSAAGASNPELGLPTPSASEGEAEYRYELFRAVRGVLKDLAQIVTDPEVKRPTGRYQTLLTPAAIDLSPYLLPRTRPRDIALTGGGVYIDEDLYNIFLRQLENTGADVWTLRFCPVCRAVFLPRREDQKACTPEHANVLRVRLSRANKPKPATKGKKTVVHARKRAMSKGSAAGPRRSK